MRSFYTLRTCTLGLSKILLLVVSILELSFVPVFLFVNDFCMRQLNSFPLHITSTLTKPSLRNLLGMELSVLWLQSSSNYYCQSRFSHEEYLDDFSRYQFRRKSILNLSFSIPNVSGPLQSFRFDPDVFQ